MSEVAGTLDVETAPAGVLATPVGPPSGAVFLKLFIPPLFDGGYLAFDGNGVPLGVVSGGGAELLARASGTPVRDLFHDDTGTLLPHQLEQVLVLMEAGLLVPSNVSSDAAWICPDTAPQTCHAGPGADRFIRYFYDYFGSVFYDGSQLIDSHGDFLAEVERYFPAEPGRLCIDLGCGSGHYTAALARRGHKVVAADISVTRLRSAESKDPGTGEIVPLHTDIEDIPLPDGTLDFAMCNFVLEHVADPLAVIDEMLRLLRPGGELVLAVPSFNIRDNLAFWLYGEAPSLNFEHLRSYGLLPGTHPWCAVTGDTLAYLDGQGAEVVQVEGANIFQGLWEPWLREFQALAARHGERFSTTWPWSGLGRQTIIFARKR